MRQALRLAILAAVLFAAHSATEKRPPGEHAIEVPMAGVSPFEQGCAPTGQIGSVVPNSAVEPFIAADPAQPDHLVGVWQQDRWTNGGSNGTVTAVSTDG